MPSTFVLGLLSAGVLCAASGQAADTVAANTSATIIGPVNLMTSWAEFPVMVTRSGSWISVFVPSVQPPAAPSNPPAPLTGTASSVRRFTMNGTLQGEFTAFLSAPTPLSGGLYSITVAFN